MGDNALINVNHSWTARLVCLSGVACALALVALPAIAEKKTQMCPGLLVRSVHVSTELEKGGIFFPDPAPKKIMNVAENVSANKTGSAGKVLTVVAIGPILGPMDAPRLRTDLSCTTQGGLLLTATIVRAADFHGAVLANVNWRPKIEIEIALRQREAMFQVAWAMRLTTGAMVDYAQTPPYGEQRYPITMTKMIRAPSLGP